MFLLTFTVELFSGQEKGGVETRSVYLQYIQGIKPNVPALTMFIEIYVNAPTYLVAKECTWTPLYHPPGKAAHTC